MLDGMANSGDGNSSQTPAASANVATSASSASQTDGTVTINGQTFILTPATTAPASVNTAITISDMVFPGNVSNYDTVSSFFTPSVNITIMPPSPVLGASIFSDTNSAVEDMPPHECCECHRQAMVLCRFQFGFCILTPVWLVPLRTYRLK